jgi:[acyl-carrier-protein] S-malonyltransferase
MSKEKKLAFIFPGQGSQYPGMGKDISEKYAVAAEIFQRADKTLAFPLSRMCFEGPEDELKLTENTQPAILATSIALLRVLQKKLEITPDFVAGHSLGEYSALVCAGGMEFEDALRTVRQRGKYMQNAVPAGTGSMAAVIGMDREKLQQLCDECSHENHVVVIANLNCPKQYVISGHSTAVEVVTQFAQKTGALIIPLTVSAPFHSPLMRKAAEELETWLEKIPLGDLKIPLINNAEARFIHKAEDIKTSLIKQVQASVLWEDAMRKLIASGVDTVIEIGPGKVLSGLQKRIDRNVKILSIHDVTGLENIFEMLKN